MKRRRRPVFRRVSRMREQIRRGARACVRELQPMKIAVIVVKGKQESSAYVRAGWRQRWGRPGHGVYPAGVGLKIHTYPE